MRHIFILFAFFLIRSTVLAQTCNAWANDTMGIPETGRTLTGKYLETTLKKNSVVRLFRSDDGKLYLRLIVTENFYFNKVAMLEIRSGSKSYYVKNTKQHKLDKTRGMFFTEIFSNYLVTLKEHGITGVIFGEAETDFTRADAAQVKQIAGCMYDDITQKKQRHE